MSRRGGRVWRGEADCAFQRLASIPDRRSRRSSPVGRRKTLNQRFLGWAVVSSLSLFLVPRFPRSIWASKIERLPIRRFSKKWRRKNSSKDEAPRSNFSRVFKGQRETRRESSLREGRIVLWTVDYHHHCLERRR